MTAVVYLFLYAGFATFVAVSLARAIRYARTPVHLRWELYPVPCGAVEQAAAMAPEILLLAGMREHNRRLWRVSWLFHAGLYLLIGALALLLVNAVFGPAMAPFGSIVLARVYWWMGAAGSAMVVAGSCGLLVRRLSPEWHNYTAPADVFNLAFFLVTVVVIAVGYLLRRPEEASMVQIVRGLLLFDTRLDVPPVMAAGLMLGAVLIAYIPTTHMAHFIAKYFAYHHVRWDDAPNRGRIERSMAECLQYRPTWSAPHVGADGRRTWAEIASSSPAVEKKR